MSKQAEVEFGEAHEERIYTRWTETSPFAAGARHAYKSIEFADFDYVVVNGEGLVLCYLEIKLRRSPLSKFGDAMFPTRKHDFARRALVKQNTPVLAVTEYGCGSLVEVDLTVEPSFRRNIKRRDRPGSAAVPHVFYEKDVMRVLVRS